MRLLFCALLCVMTVGLRAEPPTVHVVASQRMPKVDRLVAAVEQHLAGRADVQLVDLRGQQRAFDRHFDALQADLVPGDLVLALGSPAARAAAERVKQNPLLCAMTTAASLDGLSSANLHLVEEDPSADEMADALRRLWPGARRLAVVVDARLEARYEAGDDLLVRGVAAGEDVVQVLSSLSGKVDGFIFPRDPLVLNRRSIGPVVAWLKQQGRPAVGYSRFLVSAGFPAAAIIDSATVRRRVSRRVEALLFGGAQVASPASAVAVWVNRDAAPAFALDLAALDGRVQFL